MIVSGPGSLPGPDTSLVKVKEKSSMKWKRTKTGNYSALCCSVCYRDLPTRGWCASCAAMLALCEVIKHPPGSCCTPIPDLDERIERYRLRAEAGLSLFSEGDR